MPRLSAVLIPLLLALPACADKANPAPAPAAADAPTVTVLTVNGSGCPSGTATTNSSASDVTVTYTAFTVAASGRKNCQLAVQLHPGSGQVWSVTSADYTGTATVPAGGSGLVKTTYYLQGNSSNLATPSTNLPVPTSGAWNVSQGVTGVTGSCGSDAVLNVNTEVRSGASSTVTASTGDVHLSWASC